MCMIQKSGDEVCGCSRTDKNIVLTSILSRADDVRFAVRLQYSNLKLDASLLTSKSGSNFGLNLNLACLKPEVLEEHERLRTR